METLISIAAIGFLLYLIQKDKKKEKEYEEIKKLKYDPQIKGFTQNTELDKLNDKNIEKIKIETLYKAQAQQQEQHKTENPQNGIYYAKPLLTARELQAYAKLKPMTDLKGWIICPKVRLADLVHPYHNDPKFMSHFGRIKSKHVDFVICDQLMNVQGIIELDDRTHDREDRKQRDKLVDDILTSVGYKIVHTREITSNILNQFMNQ